jgi:hypothetical protein
MMEEKYTPRKSSGRVAPFTERHFFQFLNMLQHAGIGYEVINGSKTSIHIGDCVVYFDEDFMLDDIN